MCDSTAWDSTVLDIQVCVTEYCIGNVCLGQHSSVSQNTALEMCVWDSTAVCHRILHWKCVFGTAQQCVTEYCIGQD